MMYVPSEQPVVLLEEDGVALELWRAPQGGHVLVVGARIRGLDSDTIELRVASATRRQALSCKRKRGP